MTFTDEKLAYCICVSFCLFVCFFFPSVFFFFFSRAFLWRLAFQVRPVHCSRDLQTSFFSKTFIKNGSHGTIHTFKNYLLHCFQFSIFSLQQNKQYSNTFLMSTFKNKKFMQKVFYFASIK